MSHAIRVPAVLDELRVKVDALSLRERVLLFATVVMLLTASWYFMMIQPLAEQATARQAEIAAMRVRIDDANHLLEEQVLQFSSTDSEQQRRLERLERRIDELNERLGDYASELIDPAEMAHVLEGVLKQQSKLNLIRLRNLGAEPLSAADGMHSTTLYKHGLEIEFEGSYFACLEYLEDVEALPWRLYWRLLDLDVVDYPRNRVRLEVSTLSLDEEWIGA